MAPSTNLWIKRKNGSIQRGLTIWGIADAQKKVPTLDTVDEKLELLEKRFITTAFTLREFYDDWGNKVVSAP
ncbi:MAG: hypothetical protein AAGC45_11295 [Bacteroidota bacterium]